MALALYGGNFKDHAALIRRGCCHYLRIGDSQTYQARDFGLACKQIPRLLPIRWNYVISSASSAVKTQTYCQTGGWSNAAFGTTTNYGSVVGDVNSGASTPVLGCPSSKLASSGDIVYDGSQDLTWTAPNNQGGWVLQRVQNGSITTANQYMPWPMIASNGGKPWWHKGTGSDYMKAGLIVQGQSAGNGWLSVDVGIRRVGTSATGAATWTTKTIANTATIQNIGYTTAIADAANYQTNIANGLVNDHQIGIGVRGSTGYNETSKSLIMLQTIYARTDNAGAFTWNNTDGLNSGAGYDSFGRSGSSWNDWDVNYWSQTQWQEYFTASVLVPNSVTVLSILLGHNCIQVSGGVVTAAFATTVQNVITKIKAAYAAAFPSGTLHIMLETPWYNSVESNFMQSNGVAGGRSMQAVYENIVSANANMSWMSYFNYFNEAAPFDTLHADSETYGQMLGSAWLDMIDRATNFAYATQGGINNTSGIRNRNTF